MDKATRGWIQREKAVWAAHEVFKRGLKLEEPHGWETKLDTFRKRREQRRKNLEW